MLVVFEVPSPTTPKNKEKKNNEPNHQKTPTIIQFTKILFLRKYKKKVNQLQKEREFYPSASQITFDIKIIRYFPQERKSQEFWERYHREEKIKRTWKNNVICIIIVF